MENIKPPIMVTSLPVLPDPRFPKDTIIFLTTDQKLYTTDGNTWSTMVATDFSELDGELQSNQIALGAITEELIAANAITKTKIADGSIETPKLSAGAITAEKIAARTITGLEIKSGAITANEIAAATITASEIAANTITAAEIATNAITAGKIRAGAISANHISANGLHITNGKFTLTNEDNTVIIDGTSNMFKIVDTGLLAVRSGYNDSVMTDTILASAPAFTFYADFGDNNVWEPWFIMLTSTKSQGFRGGTGRRPSDGRIEFWCVGGTENGGTHYVRYFLYKEAGI